MMMTRMILTLVASLACYCARADDKVSLDAIYETARAGHVVQIAVGVKPTGRQVACDAPTTTKGVKPNGSYLVYKDKEGVVVVAPDATLTSSSGVSMGDGLDEVNAKRAARGLRPFLRDEGLTQAAFACASHRAERRLFGHTGNDFQFVPSGSSAASAGCAAYPPSYGWMSCCVDGNYSFAGAAWVMGSDGKRYMHLYVR